MQNLDEGEEGTPEKKSANDGRTAWNVCPSGPSLQLTLRLLLQGRPVALGPEVLCRSLSAGPYLLDVNILESCR